MSHGEHLLSGSPARCATGDPLSALRKRPTLAQRMLLVINRGRLFALNCVRRVEILLAGRGGPRAALREAAGIKAMTMIFDGAPLALVLEALVKGVQAENPQIICSVLLLDRETGRLHLGAAPDLPGWRET